MIIEVPDPGLVLLIGPSGSGKTTFASRHFRPAEVLSSDLFREMVGGEADAKLASQDAFLALRFVAAKRMRRQTVTVIDATNLIPRSRSPFLGLARKHGLSSAAIVFCLAEAALLRRDAEHRRLGEKVIGRQSEQLRAALSDLPGEGIGRTYILESEAVVSECEVKRLAGECPAAPAAPRGDAEQIELL